jgi:hypothetical protein
MQANGKGKAMKTLVLMRRHAIPAADMFISAYTVADDFRPDPLMLTKLATLGYSLREYPSSLEDNPQVLECLIKQDVRADNNLEPGEEWPEL